MAASDYSETRPEVERVIQRLRKNYPDILWVFLYDFKEDRYYLRGEADNKFTSVTWEGNKLPTKKQLSFAANKIIELIKENQS
jgi:hypothetical protein